MWFWSSSSFLIWEYSTVAPFPLAGSLMKLYLLLLPCASKSQWVFQEEQLCCHSLLRLTSVMCLGTSSIQVTSLALPYIHSWTTECNRTLVFPEDWGFRPNGILNGCNANNQKAQPAEYFGVAFHIFLLCRKIFASLWGIHKIQSSWMQWFLGHKTSTGVLP